jgi:4-amino-4-deoxy-L-arabinose transferase-like glycosyltransferase
MSRRAARLVALVILILGTAWLFIRIDRTPELLDADEAAWTFDGAYLDLYLSGDWSNPAWRELDPYANHPPAMKYLSGLLEHAIGRPMASLEPRRFWHTRDLEVGDRHMRMKREVASRLDPEQLLAGRCMAAAFAVLAAAALMLLAWRLLGAEAAIASGALFLLHPLLWDVAGIATPDAAMLFLSVLTILLAAELGRALAQRRRRTIPFAAALAVSLGIAFASKIVALAWALPLAAAILLFAGRRRFVASMFTLAAVFVAAAALAILLDPALHRSPIAETLARIAWRRDRIEIQQLVFAEEALRTAGERCAFLLYHLFFRNVAARLLWAPLVLAGLAAAATSSIRTTAGRRRWSVAALALFFAALTIAALPMQWPRYAAPCLPFMALLGGQGAAWLIELFQRWPVLRARSRQALLAAGVLGASLIALTWQVIGPRYLRLPNVPSSEQYLVGHLLSRSLMVPHASPQIHRRLLQYFEKEGMTRRAAEERRRLQEIGP